MREDNLKFARVLLVQTKAPEAVVVVVVVLPPGLFMVVLAALVGLWAVKDNKYFEISVKTMGLSV